MRHSAKQAVFLLFRATVFMFCSVIGVSAQQQNATAPTTPPPALPTPSITGPLQELPPAIFDAGPFGKVAANGILSGMGLWQSNHIPGDDSTQATLSNGQVFLQRTDGWFQFYLQAGASGKLVRRILHAKEWGEEIGDTSSLEDD